MIASNYDNLMKNWCLSCELQRFFAGEGAQQMPEIMPKVMDNLMPHMIGDVVPLVTQPLIDYLRGRNQE